MRVIRDDLQLCTCCLSAAVNGDSSGCDYYCGSEHVAAVDRGLEKLGPHLVPDFDSETGDGTDEFSFRPCACCESKLGGSRHRFAILGE